MDSNKLTLSVFAEKRGVVKAVFGTGVGTADLIELLCVQLDSVSFFGLKPWDFEGLEAKMIWGCGSDGLIDLTVDASRLSSADLLKNVPDFLVKVSEWKRRCDG